MLNSILEFTVQVMFKIHLEFTNQERIVITLDFLIQALVMIILESTNPRRMETTLVFIGLKRLEINQVKIAIDQVPFILRRMETNLEFTTQE